MKGIILAGGRGSRLYPLTTVISKQLLPVYNKPMIYYPLATLMQADVREILIITTPEDQENFERLLQDGSQWGIRLEYRTQQEPRGIAEALIIAKDFVGDTPFCLILGDNFFFSATVPANIYRALSNSQPCVFASIVEFPNRYGVAKLDDHNKLDLIVEKPENAPSNLAITGLYCFDRLAVEWAFDLKPSDRGELEITDINNKYCAEKNIELVRLDDASIWFDMGTPDDLLAASHFVQSIEKRTGRKIACPEQIASDQGWITPPVSLAQSSVSLTSSAL